MLSYDRLQLGLYRCILLAAPVDGQWHLILVVVQFTGCIAGETQDGRAAHTPVGDEQRPRRLEVRTRDIGGSLFHHRSHQGTQCLVGDIESKQ